MCLGGPSKSAAEWEAEARASYPEATRVIEKIVRGHSLCDEGKRIAWSSARWIQDAIVRGLDGTAPSGYNPTTAYL